MSKLKTLLPGAAAAVAGRAQANEASPHAE